MSSSSSSSALWERGDADCFSFPFFDFTCFDDVCYRKIVIPEEFEDFDSQTWRHGGRISGDVAKSRHGNGKRSNNNSGFEVRTNMKNNTSSVSVSNTISSTNSSSRGGNAWFESGRRRRGEKLESEEEEEEEEEMVNSTVSSPSLGGEEDEQRDVEWDEVKGKYICRMEVESVFYKFIIGKDGAMKRKLEATGVAVFVPSISRNVQKKEWRKVVGTGEKEKENLKEREGEKGKGREEEEEEEEEWKEEKVEKTIQEKSFVVLKGENRTFLISVKKEIEEIVKRESARLPFTHFLSLPLTGGSVIEKFEYLKKSVLSSSCGISSDVFISSQKLHFTLLLLRLYSSDRLERCRRVLEDVASAVYDAVETRSVVVNLHGLQIINDDASNVNVVYSSDISESDGLRRIHKLVDVLVEAFLKTNLISLEELHAQRALDTSLQKPHVKLHATIINTKYRRHRAGFVATNDYSGSGGSINNNNNGSESGNNRWRKYGNRRGQDRGGEEDSIDARLLLKNFGSFDFGPVRISELHLSKRSDIDSKTGYYECEKSIHLP